MPIAHSEENQAKFSISVYDSPTKENNGCSGLNANTKSNDNFDTVSVASSVGTRRGFVPLDDDTEMLCLNGDSASHKPTSHGFVPKAVSTADFSLIDDLVIQNNNNNPDMLRGNSFSPIPETLMEPDYEELSYVKVDDDNTAHSSNNNFLSNSGHPASKSDSLVDVCYSPDFLEKHNSTNTSHSESFIPLNSSIDFNIEQNNKTITSCISPNGSPYSPISKPFNNTSMEVNVSGSFLNQTPNAFTTRTSIPKPIATDDKLPAFVDNRGDNLNTLTAQSNDKNSIQDSSSTANNALAPLHPNVKHLFELANCTFTGRTSAFSSAVIKESHLSSRTISASETYSQYHNLEREKNSFLSTQNLPSSSSSMTDAANVMMNDNILEINLLKYTREIFKNFDAKGIPTADNIKPHIDDPNDCITVRNMKRWFYQIDFMLSANHKFSSDHTDHFYIDLISKANDYIQKLHQLIDLSEITSVHFSEINLYIKRLEEYVSMLDRFLRSKTVKDELDNVTVKAYINSICQLNRYDGNILHWPMFWATYQNMVSHNPTMSSFVIFRLLYDNLDGITRTLLQDIDPMNPDLQLAFSRLGSHFDNSDTVLFGLNSALRQVPFMKNTFRKENWCLLFESAMLAKRFLIGKQFEEKLRYEKECVIILLGKLAPKHTEAFFKIPDIDWTFNDFMGFCQKNIYHLEQMSYLGEDLDKIPVSEWLCPICKKDYHFPVRCDFSVEIRKQVVYANKLCVRCLEVEYFHGHDCQNKCSNCEGNHHLALCHRYRANDFKSKDTATDHHQYHSSSGSSTELAHIEMPEVGEIQADHVNHR